MTVSEIQKTFKCDLFHIIFIFIVIMIYVRICVCGQILSVLYTVYWFSSSCELFKLQIIYFQRKAHFSYHELIRKRKHPRPTAVLGFASSKKWESLANSIVQSYASITFDLHINSQVLIDTGFRASPAIVHGSVKEAIFTLTPSCHRARNPVLSWMIVVFTRP